jgi:hypothetical protein
MYQPNVTCADYRGEQRLLSLRCQLQEPGLDPARRAQIEAEIAELERMLKMD